MLDRAAILGIEDRKPTPVSIPEWGGTFFIRPMSGAERDGFEGEMIGQANRITNLRARIAVRVLCNEQGERIFSDADAEAVGAKSASALDRIFTESQKLNRIGAEEVAAVGKSSAGEPSGASGSDSPATSG